MAVVKAQSTVRTGVVVDNSADPISGASIQVIGRKIGAISDSLGRFKLALSKKDSLAISAIGFYNLTILPPSESNTFTITLKEKPNKFDSVVVKTQIKNNKTDEPSQSEKNIISHGLEDFKTSQNLTYGTTSSSGISMSSGKPQSFHTTSNQPTGKLYNGASIPVFSTTEETRGSRYLLSSWAAGSITTKDGSVVSDRELRYNYDKISKHLLLYKSNQSALELDNDAIASFSLGSTDSIILCFEKIPQLDNAFLQVLVKSEKKYALFKGIHTRFVKANYVSTGLTESGHNYDEYVDESVYYVFFPSLNTYKTIDLRKKSIKQAFADEKDKVNEYFSKLKDADIDEIFLKGLVEYLDN